MMENKIFKKITAVLTSAGIIAGSLLSPAQDIKNNEIIVDEDKNRINITEVEDKPNEIIEEVYYIEQEKKKRNWGLLFAAVPLFFLGEFLISLLCAKLVPVFAVFVSWLLSIILLLFVIVLTLKALFPEKPIKEILNKKTFKKAAVSTAVLAAGDLTLTLAWPRYNAYKRVVVLGGGIFLFILLLYPFLEKKEKTKQ